MNKLVLRASCTTTVLLVALAGMAIQVWVNGGNATCGNNTGYAIAQAGGGMWPYTYAWSNGATTDTITGLAPGTYTVTVTDANSDEATGNITISNTANPVVYYDWTGFGIQGCHGQCNGGIWYDEAAIPLNLIPPFSFSVPPTYGVNPFNLLQGAWVGFCPGASGPLTTVTDALGCVAQLNLLPYAVHDSDPSPMSIVSVTPTCTGMSGGAIVVNVGAENGAVTANWQTRLLNAAMQPVPGVNIVADPMPGWNIETIVNRPPGDYFIERRFPNYYSGDCVDLLPVTVPDLGTDCGMVSGTAYIDADQNCAMLFSEVRVPLGFVEVQPGPYYAPLTSNGTYGLSLPTGSYSITQWSPSVQEHCSVTTAPFNITAGATTIRHLPDTSIVPLDLEVVITSGPARPGFEFHCGITVRNLTPTSSGSTTLTLTFDPVLTLVSAVPNGSVAGNTITWNQTQLGAWQQRTYSIRFNVPADPGLLGTELISTAVLSSVGADGDLSNNTATNTRIITGSYDPNDKLAQTSLGSSSSWIIDEDEWIDYTIRFQNTGTDTAFNILITDTLPLQLDPATIQMGAGSHAFTWELRDQGTLKFYFQNILLPDSNYSEPLSHGFVGFRIHPRQPLLPGTVIENIANIYFDFNPPVITEPSVLVAEFSTGVGHAGQDVLRVFPNPADQVLNIALPSASGAVRIEVRSLDGRLVAAERTEGGLFLLSIANYAPGPYSVRVTGIDGSDHRALFIKH